MPVNTVKPPSHDFLLSKLQSKLGLDIGEMQILRELLQKADVILNVDGSIKPQANVSGRTEGIGTTVTNILPSGQYNSLGNIADPSIDHLTDSATFARVSTTALNGNQVDLSKSGVINQAPTSKMVNNAMLNSSNNAVVDSIDNGVNATIRVYGAPGGPGTTWNLTIGPLTQPNLPSFSGAFNYSTDYIVYWDGSSFHVILATNAFPALADSISFTGVVHTVAAGGAGGVSGGGSTTGGNKGRLTAIT